LSRCCFSHVGMGVSRRTIVRKADALVIACECFISNLPSWICYYFRVCGFRVSVWF